MSYRAGAHQLEGKALAKAQRESQVAQQGNPGGAYIGADVADRSAQFALESAAEKEKALMTEVLTGLAGGGAGRGVPAYNGNMANGRQGLVDPALTYQAQMAPLPWDEKLSSTKNLMGVQALTKLFAPSEQITAQLNSLTPQQQAAVRPKSTIYLQTPTNWVENRLNLALMRRRESSIYALV